MTSIDDALAAALRPGQQILIGQGQGQPAGLVRALGRHRDRLAGSRLLVGLLQEDLPELPETDVITFYPSAGLASAEGLRAYRATYVRHSLYDLSASLHDGTLSVDVALAQASTPRDGRRSLGSTVDLTAPAIARAQVSVLEVSTHVPWTGPRSIVPDSAEAIVVESAVAPLRSPLAGPGQSGELARGVLDWVPDGATLELGIGRWASDLAAVLADRRGLRVHTGALSDWVLSLHAAGALRDGVPIVAADLGGSSGFYDALGDLPAVDLAPAYETHSQRTLTALPSLRAINSVFEVDLCGRANCEVGPRGRLGGIAGLRDFAAGAAANPDGMSILVLPADAHGTSRIVPRLPDGRVSLDSNLVDVVVTEFGSADLRGANGPERIRRLIACAHPRHRAWLRAAARQEGIDDSEGRGMHS